MSGKIPQSFIETLIDRTDIVTLIDGFVGLRKAGHEFVACCPFHSEKTPSFTVSPKKQFYHCFGCGAHGTAIGFLMEYSHMDFVESVEELASRLGLDVPRESARTGVKAPPPKQDFSTLETAAQIYRNLLNDEVKGRLAREYLDARGVDPAIRDRYLIGYAPDNWDTLSKTMGTSTETTDALLSCGLLTTGDTGRSYDRFRGRIMFPIRDIKGRIIGFGGRVTGQDSPKYLNSPETPTFHKGRALYGLYELCQSRES